MFFLVFPGPPGRVDFLETYFSCFLANRRPVLLISNDFLFFVLLRALDNPFTAARSLILGGVSGGV